MESAQFRREAMMVALVVLLLILAILGGLGFAAHFLWFVLIAAVLLWAIGFLVGGAEAGLGRRRWYGRW
jgi:fatty-acid desaturase